MSFSTMQELKDELSAIASSRGHTSTEPTSIVYNNANTAGRPVQFIVSDEEPYALPAPLNTIWYVTGTISGLSGFVMRRTSRASASGLQNTWESIADATSLFDAQIWDIPKPAYQGALDHANTVGNAHLASTEDLSAVNTSGDKMEGMLEPRTLPEGEEFDSKEVVPRSWIEAMLAPIRAANSGIMQSFGNTYNQIRNIRDRVQVLENVVPSSSSEGFVYRAVEASASWSISHNMDNSELLIQVYEGAEMVWPASITVADANTVLIEFAEPVAGRADLLPIVERT